MKNIVLVIVFMVCSSTAFAQKKNAKASFKVDGVCMMCKKRIEKATLGMKGVKYAVWNVKTHDLNLIFDERKTSVAAIKQTVVGVGHDTEEIKATKEAYETLDPCCRYRDEEVVKDHQ